MMFLSPYLSIYVHFSVIPNVRIDYINKNLYSAFISLQGQCLCCNCNCKFQFIKHLLEQTQQRRSRPYEVEPLTNNIVFRRRQNPEGERERAALASAHEEEGSRLKVQYKQSCEPGLWPIAYVGP